MGGTTGTIYVPGWGGGSYGSCLVGNSVSSYVNTGQRIQDVTASEGTLLWSVYPNGAYNDSQNHPWFAQILHDATAEFTGQKYTNNKFYVGFNGTGHETRIVLDASATNYPQQQWSHFALTWVNGGETKLYRNGVYLATNGGGTYVQSPAIGLYLGRIDYLTIDKFLSGKLDLVRIFSRALTAEAIRQLYLDPFGMYRPQRIPLWRAGIPGTPIPIIMNHLRQQKAA